MKSVLHFNVNKTNVHTIDTNLNILHCLKSLKNGPLRHNPMFNLTSFYHVTEGQPILVLMPCRQPAVLKAPEASHPVVSVLCVTGSGAF